MSLKLGDHVVEPKGRPDGLRSVPRTHNGAKDNCQVVSPLTITHWTPHVWDMGKWEEDNVSCFLSLLYQCTHNMYLGWVWGYRVRVQNIFAWSTSKHGYLILIWDFSVIFLHYSWQFILWYIFYCWIIVFINDLYIKTNLDRWLGS